MKNKKIYKLKNGPKVVLYQDTSKHITLASLFVKFGGKDHSILLDNKIHDIPTGMAHFMEHLLIEHSIYGNSLLKFEEKNTKSNGYTSRDKTEFVINSVASFEEDLIKLINIVNKRAFTKEDVEETKKAIIKEKMMEEDKNFESLNKLDYETLFTNIAYPNILGKLEDLRKIDYNIATKCHDVFYRKENQLLVISGNFKIGKIKKIIKEQYNKLENSNISCKHQVINEPNEVKIKSSSIKRKVNIDYVRLNYKINISNLSPKDKVKLDFYMSYFLSYSFGSTSKVYNKLSKNKICVYGIESHHKKVDEFLILKIGTFTNKHDKFIEEIENVIKNRKLDREFFEISKKRSIINIILRDDSLADTIEPFIDNITTYDYFEIDRIEDIEEETFEEYKEMIESLDFTNYTVTKMLREEVDNNE